MRRVSSVLHPVGRHHPAVYWRRRVVLLLAVAAVAGVVWMLVGGGRADEAAATGQPPAPAPVAAATSEPTEQPTEQPTACEDAALDVAVATDATGYGPDDVPRLTLTVTNAGEQPCTVDLGSADAVELVVTSGSDRIWSSDDCQQAAEPRVVPLEPGAAEEQVVSWQRLRSAEGCPGELGDARPGTYQVTGRVGAVTSEPVVFTLT